MFPQQPQDKKSWRANSEEKPNYDTKRSWNHSEVAKYSKGTRCDGCGKQPFLRADGSEVILKKCSRCRSVAYHNVDCQRSHFKQHRPVCLALLGNCKAADVDTARLKSNVNEDYVILERGGRGKCLIASREYARAEVFWNSNQPFFEPFVPPVLIAGARRQKCAVCFGRLRGPSHLSEHGGVHMCQLEKFPVSVCSKACIEKAQSWLGEEICCVESVTHIPVLLPTAILIYRLMRAVVLNEVSWDELAKMQTHSTLSDPCAEAHEHAVRMTAAAMLNNTFPIRAQTLRAKQLSELLSRVKVNAFTISDESGYGIGVGLFKTAHRINHSCIPNAIQCFLYGEPGHIPSLRLTAKVSIRAQDEVTISYIDHNLDRRDRQDLLRKDYQFRCRCELCGS
jgi:phage FluMu protein Com